MSLQQHLATDKKYMSRCIQLAKSGMGYVAPNPMVGALLVYGYKVIGEGFHKKYGEPHAEVNCIMSVNAENKSLIEKSTMYVSLEPCSHYGKTPPCADLILESKINRVVIGCKDVNEKVSGRGIKKLQEARVNVVSGILEEECVELNKRFFTFHQKKRPYILLKWAQTADRKIGSENEKRVLISNEYSNRLVHKWRSEEAAIMVGTHTAIKDNPSLTTRLWRGKNPVRIVIDKDLKLPSTLNLFDSESNTIVINTIKDSSEKHIRYIKIDDGNFLEKMLMRLYESEIQSILVEGGANTLQSFIDACLWDEARIITNEKMTFGQGIDSPKLKGGIMIYEQEFENDRICFYSNT
ncbi:MAG: bifunctional diaminohydroxyphosphoribosylaminopyrimidine deaminase/5-amino-6-(5-phosphoribosylamino)uracil reductase RibD [Ginsengibacter sp.]